MRLGLTLAVLLGLAVVANAGLSLQVVGAPTAGLPGYTTWTLTINSPEMLNAIDAKFVGAMNQLWFGGAFSTVLMNDVAMGMINQAQDSHLLIASTDQIGVVRQASETNVGGTGNWIGYSDGVQTFAFGIAAASQKASLPFAQLVLPDSGQGVHFIGTWTANGVTGLPAFDFLIAIPEPATLSLLGVGALALIRRRR